MQGGVLVQCPALSQLYLGDNHIGAEGAQGLAGALPQCPALSILGLGDNEIGPEGAESAAAV
jgi:Ran GTPase-activating protein (RanGAP) involved in mRNA processing and transport